MKPEKTLKVEEVRPVTLPPVIEAVPRPYFESIGTLYYLRIGSWIGLSLIAINVNNRTYQAAFAVFALLTEVLFILTAQLTMG